MASSKKASKAVPKKAAVVAKKKSSTSLVRVQEAPHLPTVHSPTSQQEIQQLVAVQAPHFSASSTVIQDSGNNFTLVLSQVVPLVSTAGQFTNIAKNVPVAVLTLSPQTVKDLSLLLTDSVQKHEAKFGVLQTNYSRALAASKAKPVAKSANGIPKKGR